MPSEPLAFFLTWTCHGTWLHGDDRGSVDQWHNTHGEPYADFDPALLQMCSENLIADPVFLSPDARKIVGQTIIDHCLIRKWVLHAQNPRSNHIHVVLSCDIHPDKAREQLKAWSTRRLREAGLFPADRKIWTEDGSDRWLWDELSAQQAVKYVLEDQD